MQKLNTNKILSVVVTYNRLLCLKECIAALRNQSLNSFDILIVNNGSNDGTQEYLDSLSDIIVVTQENVGGAGGFFSGMKYGYEHNYEWIWMMDDDGIPDKNQLQELIKHGNESLYLNALVVDKDNHTEFAFKPLNSNVTVASLSINPVSSIFVHPFNGTLFNRKLIEKIGFIKKEMFIWGDEKEYTHRAIKNGITPITITSALHYHPKEKGNKRYTFGIKSNLFYVLVKPPKMSHYYYRNLGFIDKEYRDLIRSCKQVFVYSMFFIRTLNFVELKKFIVFYFRGRRNLYKN